MKYDIVTAGFPLVEIMRKELDQPFTVAADFIGPYPSGDTCIFIDVAARLGNRCGHFGVVGDDPFGQVILNRLAVDGVDTSLFRVTKEKDTGVAFVSYRNDGTREFLFYIQNNACGLMDEDDMDCSAIQESRWVHFSGEPVCENEQSYRAMRKMLEAVSKDTLVSIDPNVRTDLPGIERWLAPFLERADYIFPSEQEAGLMMGLADDEKACQTLAAQGKVVALKLGKEGCRIYQGENKIQVPAFMVDEIDPTGCGDSFCAGFITGVLKGWSFYDAGLLANAAGALQATAKGPMEGAKYLHEVLAFMAAQGVCVG